jgi:hypothetical protein
LKLHAVERRAAGHQGEGQAQQVRVDVERASHAHLDLPERPAGRVTRRRVGQRLRDRQLAQRFLARGSVARARFRLTHLHHLSECIRAAQLPAPRAL